MKKTLFIICLSFIILSCKKNGVQPKGYIGTWEMIQTSGTIAGTTATYPKNEGNLLILNPDSTYIKFVKFQQSTQGRYHVVKNGVYWNNNTYDGIFFDGNTRADFAILKENELTIGNTIPDGITTLYERRR